MKWKNREKEIRRLRKKHPAPQIDRMPDLSSSRSTYPSLSSTGLLSGTCAPRRPSPTLSLSSDFVVGTPHKQGAMLMPRSELPWAGGKKS